MNRCKDCKHCSVNRVTGNSAAGSRPQELQCMRIEHERHDDVATVVDYEGYNAWLLVKPEFGCVLWEAKDVRT